MNSHDFLVLNAMRLAERAHRQRNHWRKAPPGEDRPAYFLHLAEVAWLLIDSGVRDEALIAAAYLHDSIEDCEYDERSLADALGNVRVAALVAAVSEIDKGQSWETRQQQYRERLATLDEPATLALSCADKTANLMDMNRPEATPWTVSPSAASHRNRRSLRLWTDFSKAAFQNGFTSDFSRHWQSFGSEVGPPPETLVFLIPPAGQCRFCPRYPPTGGGYWSDAAKLTDPP